MDIFEQLLIATIPTNTTSIKVTSVGKTTCIRGEKKTTLHCADGVSRVMHYRGSLNKAVPTGHITVTDITMQMSA